MMRLLYITDNGFFQKNNQVYFDGSNKTHINNLSNYFSDFCVIARNSPENPNYSLVPKNVETHLVDKYNIIRLRKEVKTQIKNCDAVICYGINGSLVADLAKKYDLTLVAYSGGDMEDFIKAKKKPVLNLCIPAIVWLQKKMFRLSDYGHYCHEYLTAKYPSSGVMMGCSGVDVVCSEDILRSRLKKICNSQHEKIIIGLVGYLNSIKGIDIAIKAISSLDKKYNLEIVGRGDNSGYKELARELHCEERIRFLGTKKPGEDMMNWLDSLDIYIQPSRAEGLPRACIEAMSRGCPVVATNVGAVSHLVDNCYVIRSEDYKQLAIKLRELEDSNNMINQAKRNFAEAKKYERSVREKKYAEFYTMVAESAMTNKKI